MSDVKIRADESPFQSSHPRFDFWSEAHCVAAEQLDFAMASLNPVTLFTGAVGIGKTTVVRKVVQETQSLRLLGLIRHSPILSVSPARAILAAFGADPGAGDPERHERILRASLARVRSSHGLPSILVEDAQLVSTTGLRALIDLADGSPPGGKPCFKLVLIGYDEIVASFGRNTRGAYWPAFELMPMSEQDTHDYVRHRLAVAGYDRSPFSENALQAVFEYSEGNPLLTNVISMLALDEAESLGLRRIDRAQVEDCAISATDLLDLTEDAEPGGSERGAAILRNDDIRGRRLYQKNLV